MNRWWFAWVVKRYFPLWLAGATLVVADHERCLRSEEPMEEFKALGIQMVPDYPPCSQDLNAIENAWGVLRERLASTQPTEFEDRDAFVARLKNAVTWINNNRRKQLLRYCNNQKERAAAVLHEKGNRTDW